MDTREVISKLYELMDTLRIPDFQSYYEDGVNKLLDRMDMLKHIVDIIKYGGVKDTVIDRIINEILLDIDTYLKMIRLSLWNLYDNIDVIDSVLVKIEQLRLKIRGIKND
ncbi:MAG: hypothetical protein QXW71_01935 [Thermoplasmata archaeon]